jgi:hypothetical protein
MPIVTNMVLKACIARASLWLLQHSIKNICGNIAVTSCKGKLLQLERGEVLSKEFDIH